MAAHTFFDVKAMLVELEQLERREQQVSKIRRRLHDRIDAFPNEALKAQEREISAERRELHQRIDALRARLELGS
jgi:hypothetical protein